MCRLPAIVGAIVLLALSSQISYAATTPPAATTTTISQTCGKTRYPSLCLSTLSKFSSVGASAALGAKDLVQISLKSTLRRLRNGLYDVSADVSNVPMDSLVRSAYEDCVELLDGAAHHLSRSLGVFSSPYNSNHSVGSDDDVHTWLSAALTNQDTCMESLNMIPTDEIVKDRLTRNVEDLTKHVSNSLSIFVTTQKNQDLSGIPIDDGIKKNLFTEHFPSWVSRMDRRLLLQSPVLPFQPNFIVSKDGNGTHTTIIDAVRAVPHNSTQRIIIYVKAGRYDENVKVGMWKTNIMLIGEGKGKTIIDGNRSVYDNFTTFHTATFAVTGNGFIARDMTFENSADPSNHQAVALRVGADHAVFYHCNIIGYQDTLYVHSLRQFFRECDIYGTVDFIFGNAAVVFQNCNIWTRKPLDHQKITITAQSRKDQNQNTGISIHSCQVIPTSDFHLVASSYPTYLGRPWRLYSRTVYMQSYLAEHVHEQGWLEWNGNFALDTLYYGEYMNYGPGAGLGNRVTWKGYRVLQLAKEALEFTVGQFIDGSTWLPSTNISFFPGLSSKV